MWNQVKTVLLLGVLSVVLIAIGGAIGPGFLAFAAVVAVAMNLGAYFFSDRIVLKMHGARELTAHEAPALHGMVQELAASAGIPAPRLYRIPDPQPNAFATGRDPQRGVVAVTDGLIGLMGSREVRGVIAHEIAHIRNRDVLISTVAAMLAGTIAWVANALQFGMLFGSSDDDEGGSVLGLLAAAIVAPIAATLIQLGVSRSREFVADETAARLTGDPEGLAQALERLGALSGRVPAATARPATASLFIVSPLAGAGGVTRWIATHPPIAERVRRLRQSTGVAGFRRVA